MRTLPKANVPGFLALGTIASLACMALANWYLAKRAEQNNPSEGHFVEEQGFRLHYIDRGQGPAVVFLHGNGSMIADFDSAGILDAASTKFRAIAFDRPGFGHSPRPRGTQWTPQKQAALLAAALTKIGIQDAIVVGHSWGTLIAIALALEHPDKVKGLVLASGYYFPTPRPDAVLGSTGAVPGLGNILCHTLLPLMGRITWPAVIRSLFSPRGVPAKFWGFSKEMALRPSQLRASAEETALMVPSTEGLADAYKKLTIPVAVICGAGDQIVDPHQSTKFHRVLKDSTLSTLLFNGHMVHHTALTQVLAAIDGVAGRSNVSNRA
jgi:pimeloyl-ACP methyl ester carboxylesterase